MRLKLLLMAMLLSAGILNAQQDTIKGLIITEAYVGSAELFRIELTNLGNEPINLKTIEFGEMRPWGTAPTGDGQWVPPADRWWMLPDFILQPGASFVMASARDWTPKQFAKGLEGYGEKNTPDDMWPLMDMQLHTRERNSAAGDSVSSENISAAVNDCSNGRSCFFIRQHINETDSVVLDQVNGWFDGDGTDGGTQGLNKPGGAYDIAGVDGAAANSWLIRKYVVKQGNLVFAAGLGDDDGEWIVVPREGGSWRATHWTVGNHGDYNLDENTLESDIADIDFANKVITVPWGTRRPDGVMGLMKKKPGIAWNYHCSPAYEDSASFACATGDMLEIFVCGNDVDRAMFNIVVAEPTDDANIVVPVSNIDPDGDWRDNVEDGDRGLWSPRVTTHGENDTIWGARGGIDFAMRVDSLLERLEKPSNAAWELEWVDGADKRADLKNGDVLKVTSANGSVKRYFISVQEQRKNINANLSAITWPDIPEWYRGIYGWKGDTIPGFTAANFNYRISVPVDVDGIPALVAKKEQLNSTVQVTRASSLSGTQEQRTVTFTVTAEDDTTVNVYTVEMVKEKDPAKLQPYHAEPFISEYVFWDLWSNTHIEIANPGNQPLDLSNYMIIGDWAGDPATAITWHSGVDDWSGRFSKYVPGYKWVSEAQWAANPGIMEQDLNVNPIVMPGDVFVMSYVGTASWTKGPHWWDANYDWPVDDNWDVQFNNYTGTNGPYLNPWNESVGETFRNWCSSWAYLVRIDNDSIKMGLKPANDPNDFTVIEQFGMADGSNWNIAGVDAGIMCIGFIRKPEIYEGNDLMQASFGTNPDDSEWTYNKQTTWQQAGKQWPGDILFVGHNLGQHFMNTPTHYMSTVSSVVYKVSDGYSMKESIRGMTPGVTVGTFMANLIKPNENQTLKVKAMADGSELAMDALLSNMDTLVVMSADSTNTSKYILEVAEGGLSSNAVLTSTRYTVTIEIEPKSAGNENAGIGNLKGFDYGTALRTILANITVPAGASMDVINGEGAYVATKAVNFDSTYVNVTVNDNIYLSVTAENGVTQIIYQLVPSVSENDAFITSDVYNVVQKDLLVDYVPRGTSVGVLFSNIAVSFGASVKLVDKYGLERTVGGIAQDDKIVVTSPNGLNTRSYHLSMLATKNTPDVTYLAYILSSVYQVDQVMYMVDGVAGTETVSAFLSKVKPAEGATAMVVNKDGMDKTSGDIDRTDMVKVTSADGRIMVYYTFGTLTSVGAINDDNIELYPNPTNGEINISGLKAGYRIQVYNSVGAAIRDINVQSSIERISLKNQPAGMYMVVVSENNKMLGRYKAIKQ